MSEARDFDLSGGSPPATPALEIVNSEDRDPAGSFFDRNTSSDEFSLAVFELQKSLDLGKMYGLGTVIAPVPSAQLRHLMKITGIHSEKRPDEIITSYQKVVTQYEGSSPDNRILPHHVATYIAQTSNEPQYIIPYAVTLALLRTDARQKAEIRMGPYKVQQLYGQLSFAINPDLFQQTYRMLSQLDST